ncbi:MAG: glycoside hydrolase family 97 protein [Planctomycetota bacterium]|nr:MAG: glycoside hydrolase family 97 protein [Planctomycetota bacterium]
MGGKSSDGGGGARRASAGPLEPVAQCGADYPGSVTKAVRLLALGAVIAAVMAAAPAAAQEGVHELRSPDGRVAVTVRVPAGEAGELPAWSLRFRGRELVEDGRFGLVLEGGTELFAGAAVDSAVARELDERVAILFGKADHARARARELRLELRAAGGRGLVLVLRAYDDAFAFRYEVGGAPGEEPLRIAAETTAFDLAGAALVHATWLPHFRTSHEFPVQSTPPEQIPDGQLLDTPLTAEFPGGAALAITEAALRRYAGMSLRREAESGRLAAALSPRDDGLAVVAAVPLVTPWRVVLVGDGVGALLESNTLYCLNEPPVFDTSWIRPGKLTWPWWNHYLFEAEHSEPILSVESARKHLDWCAANGIAYHAIVADESDTPWYRQGRRGLFPDAETDPTQPRADLDLPAIRKLAGERGVGLWTWVHQAAIRGRVEESFAAFAQLGWSGIMVDFLDRDDQDTVEFAEEVLAAAARHHVLVHFHGMYKPTGWQRTFPHLMNHEGSLNLEYLKWGGACTPEHTLRVVFTRLLAGPMDYHLGGFRAAAPADFQPRNEAPLVLGTRGHMLGLYVCLDNPAPMVADFPAAYRDQPGFDCLREVPTWWDETRVLQAEVGRLLVSVRRRGSVWWLGAIAAGEARVVEVPLKFLPAGEHALRLWRDGAGAAEDPNQLEIEEREVRAGAVLRVLVAPGGGFVARLERTTGG